MQVGKRIGEASPDQTERDRLATCPKLRWEKVCLAGRRFPDSVLFRIALGSAQISLPGLSIDVKMKAFERSRKH
jgi:hypothetical protein